MNGFIAIAGLLTLAALIALLYPLLRKRESSPEAWRSGGLAAVLIALGAAALYPLWSNYDWQAPAQAADSPEAMVGRLARRLEKQPDDLAGWLQLGRSYTVLEQFALAARAYEQADKLANGKNAEAAMGLAEALFNNGNDDLSGRVGRLFEQAMEVDPTSTKALFYSAMAAAERNELPLAKQRFQRLLDANPPDNVRELIGNYIKQLDAESNLSASAQGSSAAGVVTAPVHVTRSTAVAAIKLPATARLFVMARVPGQAGPPVAVQLLEPRFPQDVDLRNTDALMGGAGFKAGQEIEIEARISLDGGANSKTGDPYGTVRQKAGAGSRATLEIGQLKP
jgi:cytochrome c-type biogenesis protein CcmH